jgi:ubiquinone biosynthesis protein
MLLRFRQRNECTPEEQRLVTGFEYRGRYKHRRRPPLHRRRRCFTKRERMSRAAVAAVKRWRVLHPRALRPRHYHEPVLRRLPRPKGLGIGLGDTTAFPPRRHDINLDAGFWMTLGRLVLWFRGAFHFLFGILWDKLRGRDSEERRAVRLRETIEKMGTTFIKVGQQMSMRLDVLPYHYTRELAKMLDSVPPFPTEQAIAAIEKTSGKKLDEIFLAFDPEPIGSASVACVYQAILRDGERVAVKVRRPGIVELLGADMRALSWMLILAELVILRPGFTDNLLFELTNMLAEEMDFVREARFTDIWRRNLKKPRMRQLAWATSPKVFFKYSGEDVLVTEFVTGVWLAEVLAAVESDDTVMKAKLEKMDIDPKVLARRILMISRYGNFEHIFFHADLHPANVLIRPGNEIVLIDFGSCGSFTKRELIAWRRMFDAQGMDDVGGMAQAALGVLEPLPPIDKDQFAQRLEQMFWNDMYAIKSKHSEWWERISARLWIGFLKLAREFSIPMRLNTLRMIRAIMLADTIAARLDHDIDPYDQYRLYEKGAGRRARHRLRKRLRRIKNVSRYIRFETLLESSLMAVYRIQRALYSVGYIRILPMISKAAMAWLTALRTGVVLTIMAAIIALFIILERPDKTFLQAMMSVMADGKFQLIALVPIGVALRRMFLRMSDPEYSRRR